MRAGEVASSPSWTPSPHHPSDFPAKMQSWKSAASRAITFGSPKSSHKVAAFVNDQFESVRWSDRNRWDFDFHSERPTKCSGRYEWKSISSSSSKTAATGDSCTSFYGFRQ